MSVCLSVCIYLSMYLSIDVSMYPSSQRVAPVVVTWDPSGTPVPFSQSTILVQLAVVWSGGGDSGAGVRVAVTTERPARRCVFN